MKKLLLVSAFVLTASIASAEKPINPKKLPQNVQTFVSTNFPGAGIVSAEEDTDSYELKLNNGAELDIEKASGNWKSIKSYTNFPVKALPAAVVDSVKKAHPQAMIVEAEREMFGFDIKTNNNFDLQVTESGQIVKQQQDD